MHVKSKIWYRIFMAGSTAVLIAGPVILALLLGLWIDGLLQTSPIFALVGGMVGFVGSIMALLKILKT
jgi:F0F1-type ATP synthase assembly protein I